MLVVVRMESAESADSRPTNCCLNLRTCVSLDKADESKAIAARIRKQRLDALT
jgi:hypothetical protein